MRTRPFALALALAAITAVPAHAQSSFGDTQLSYQNGVVYDDDLVPGRRVNQPYLIGEQSGGNVSGNSFGRVSRTDQAVRRAIPENSRNLIGADGRAIQLGR